MPKADSENQRLLHDEAAMSRVQTPQKGRRKSRVPFYAVLRKNKGEMAVPCSHEGRDAR